MFSFFNIFRIYKNYKHTKLSISAEMETPGDGETSMKDVDDILSQRVVKALVKVGNWTRMFSSYNAPQLSEIYRTLSYLKDTESRK